MEINFDEKLLQRLVHCDSAAAELLVTSFKKPVRLNLRIHLRSFPQLVDDASQEVFLRVLAYFRSGKTLDNPNRLPAFIHSVCRNVAMEQCRAQLRYGQIPESNPECADLRNPEDGAITNQRVELVRTILNELPERDRELLRRLLLNEEDKDQVCAEFQIQRSYLRVLLHRARIRFKVALMGDTPAGSHRKWHMELADASAGE